MKTLVIFDSTWGNTEKIARVIGGTVSGEVKIIRVGEVNIAELKNFDLIFFGSPTLGGRPTENMQNLLNDISENAIKSVRFASFDTRLTSRWVSIFGYTAAKINENLKNKGAKPVAPPEGFFVKSREGPLKDGELERAVSWVKSISTTFASQA